jgi:hypothetical protein
MDRLDEIRARHERVMEWSNRRQRGVSTAREDIGYLLGLLVEHPASEPPGDNRVVIVRVSGKRMAGLYQRGQWFVYQRVGFAPRGDVESWQELPPVEGVCTPRAQRGYDGKD